MAGSKKLKPHVDERGREWITAAEAARRYGRTGAAYTYAKNQGQIEVMDLGRRTVMLTESVEAYVERLHPGTIQKQPATSAPDPAVDPPSSEPSIPDLNRSKQLGEYHKARMAKIKADQAEGLLIPIEQLEFAYEKAGLILQQKLRGLGPLLAPYMTDAGNKLFKRSVDDILSEVVRALEEAAEAQDDEEEEA